MNLYLLYMLCAGVNGDSANIRVLPFSNFGEFIEFDEFVWDMWGIK